MGLSATQEWNRLCTQVQRTLSIRNKNQDTAVPVEHQVALLGLDPTYMQGERLYDIACGSGGLVQWLREHGVNAFGIDARAPLGPYFTQRMVTGRGRQYGLPVLNRSLHYVTSFQNLALNTAFRTSREHWIEDHNGFGRAFAGALHERYLAEGHAMIAEIGRTLIRGGQGRIYPPLFNDTLLSKEELRTRHALIVGYEPIDPRAVLAYMHSEGHHTVTPETLEREDKDLTYRCIFLKK